MSAVRLHLTRALAGARRLFVDVRRSAPHRGRRTGRAPAGMLGFIALIGLIGVAQATPRGAPVDHRALKTTRRPLAHDVAREPHRVVTTHAARAPSPWAQGLAPIAVRSRNTGEQARVRLYQADGTLDPDALATFMRTAASAKGQDEPLEPRLVQLAIRASYHFGGKAIVVVSATRAGARGKHGEGHALDFQLEGVRAATLAAFLRTYPRAGVGIYTHPRTQFVHLDVRDRSFHWIDASPPGVTWRERLLPDPSQARRDAAYDERLDLPEAASR